MGAILEVAEAMALACELSETLRSTSGSIQDTSRDLRHLNDELLAFKALFPHIRDALEDELSDIVSSQIVSELKIFFEQLNAVLRDMNNVVHSAPPRLKLLASFRRAETTQHINSVCTDYLKRIHHQRQKLETQLFKIPQRIHHVNLDELHRINLEIDQLNLYLPWLSPLNFEERHSQLLKSTSNSHFWILDDPKFKSWIEEPGKVLWCTGPPGSGKTYQCSLVIEHLKKSFETHDFVGYVYFDHLHPYDPADVVGSFIKQFVSSFGPHVSLEDLRYWHSVNQSKRPDLRQAASILASLLKQATRAFLIFDAIDEYPDHTEDFIHDLMVMMDLDHVNIFMTSRVPLSSNNHFKDASKLDIREKDEEIIALIDKRVNASPYLMNLMGKDKELHDLVVRKIKERPSGLSHYANLALDEFEFRKYTSEGLRYMLTEQSSNAEHFYLKAMERLKELSSGNFEVALEILTWLAFARTPLTSDELQAAMEIQVGESNQDKDRTLPARSLLDKPLNLTFLDQSKRVLLVHQSVKEFLQKWIPEQLDNISGGPHALITRKCLTCLCQGPLATKVRDRSGLDDRLKDLPLLRYAAVNWGYHAQKCFNNGSQNCKNDLQSAIMHLFQSDYATEASGMIMELYEAYPGRYTEAYLGMRGLHLASAFGLSDIVKYLIQEKQNCPEWQTEGNWTALHWASRRGSKKVVSVLLKQRNTEQREALIRMKTNLDEWTALHLAAKEGHLDIVEILYNAKADLNSMDARGMTPLFLACRSRRVPVVRFLLSNNAAPNLPNVFGTTALHCVTKMGDLSLIKILLGFRDIDVNVKDTLGYTALDEAIRYNNDSAARLLKTRGATSGTALATRPQVPKSPVWGSIPDDFRWRLYQVDQEKTGLVKNGAQCVCQVLTMPRMANMRVFRKAFDITNEKSLAKKHIMSERDILSRIWHPHIVLYLDSDIDPELNVAHLYMEYCDMGDLQNSHSLPSDKTFIKNETDQILGLLDSKNASKVPTIPLGGVETWALIWQVSSALAYLHYGLAIRYEVSLPSFQANFERNWEYIIHRDVKPANVVKQSVGGGTFVFKLCDLGIATLAGQGDTKNQTQFVGTQGMEPPEVRSGDCWTRKGDIYSLGATILSTAKQKDNSLTSGPFEKLMESCVGRRKKKRKSSLCIMRIAYEELLHNDRIEELPPLVIREMRSSHTLLECEEGSYLLTAVRVFSSFLDTKEPFGDQHSKDHRKSTIRRLGTLLEDSTEEDFLESHYEYPLHLLVLLVLDDDEDDDEEDETPFSKLKSRLSSEGNPNVAWDVSGWTPLHLAVQEGKEAVVDLLLEHGADAKVQDVHGHIPFEYASEGGFTHIAEKLRASHETK